MLDPNIEVPTRAGVLRGLHWAPQSPSTAPVVLVLTPYGADRYRPDGTTFASAGFHFVSLDVRGRGGSDGHFRPFVHDGDDGHDAVRWLAGQEWSSGEVVMYGGSYSGFAQWATAARRPPGLRAIAPVASVHPGIDFPMAHNIPKAFAARWLAMVDGRWMSDDDAATWAAAGRDLVSSGRPFRDLDVAASGRRLPTFQEWLDHPSLDEYWTRLAPTRRQYEQITLPVLTITGQYDDDQLGALTFHDRHVAAAPPEAAARHQVVIGPWDHGGTRSAARSFGGLTFAENSAIDLPALHLAWYRWVLGMAGRPEFLRERVTYFHVGEDRWRSAAQLPAGDRSLRLHPLADGASSDPARRSLATTPAAVDHTVSFRLDPRAVGRPEYDEPAADRTFTDDRPLAGTNGEATVHVSEPLTEYADVSGRPRAELTLSSELRDFDLLVGLYLLPSSGTPRLLGEAGLRARYHAGLHRPEPWPSGRPVPVALRDFPFISLRVGPGDRFALVIRAPHRRWQPNHQAGGPVADESAQDAVSGVVRLHQGPSHPSSLSLPIAVAPTSSDATPRAGG
ncbi:CocE/NonD family hydrolase [Saccharopolyspora sp. NPDC002686]|uniref:CocE/NonD family hydrolase n=1 Tax=Saccharopolyspora sp. NPDC002686 TaxID=3154541 RepID=UPI00332F4667